MPWLPRVHVGCEKLSLFTPDPRAGAAHTRRVGGAPLFDRGAEVAPKKALPEMGRRAPLGGGVAGGDVQETQMDRILDFLDKPVAREGSKDLQVGFGAAHLFDRL